MANVPRAREILTEALEHNMDSEVRMLIEEALQEMYRVYENGKAPHQSRKMTPSLAKQVIALRNSNPQMTQQDIAVHFKINAGRVSEALSGKYK